jgi:hypothetical protein
LRCPCLDVLEGKSGGRHGVDAGIVTSTRARVGRATEVCAQSELIVTLM